MLEIEGGALRCRTLHPYGSRLGDWILNRKDRIVGVGNLAGFGNRQELLFKAGK